MFKILFNMREGITDNFLKENANFFKIYASNQQTQKSMPSYDLDKNINYQELLMGKKLDLPKNYVFKFELEDKLLSSQSIITGTLSPGSRV